MVRNFKRWTREFLSWLIAWGCVLLQKKAKSLKLMSSHHLAWKVQKVTKIESRFMPRKMFSVLNDVAWRDVIACQVNILSSFNYSWTFSPFLTHFLVDHESLPRLYGESSFQLLQFLEMYKKNLLSFNKTYFFSGQILSRFSQCTFLEEQLPLFEIQ